MALPPASISRTFAALAVLGLVLLFGLASAKVSGAVLVLVLYVASLVLILYFRSIRK